MTKWLQVDDRTWLKSNGKRPVVCAVAQYFTNGRWFIIRLMDGVEMKRSFFSAAAAMRHADDLFGAVNLSCQVM